MIRGMDLPVAVTAKSDIVVEGEPSRTLECDGSSRSASGRTVSCSRLPFEMAVRVGFGVAGSWRARFGATGATRTRAGSRYPGCLASGGCPRGLPEVIADEKKRSYATIDVEKFDGKAVVPLLSTGCIVAIDVAKTKFVAAIAMASGDVVKLVKVEHRRQTRRFLEQLSIMSEAGEKPIVVMDPTGTTAVRF